ncbi:TolC family protein [Endozoicomonas atrinae]|uniref:TolC family protein n=1 Tax=Endozoicomonas atrinae TaxID=1333660 RepID=UPI003AFFE66D
MLLNRSIGVVRYGQQLAAGLGVCLLMISSAAVKASEGLTLAKAEQLALAMDNGVKQFTAQSSMIEQESIAAGGWMDPKLSIGTMNLPGSDLDPLNQGMLEFKVEQMLPRGSSNRIQQNQLQLKKEAMDAAAENRLLLVRRDVRLAWYDVWYWQRAVGALTSDRDLYESLIAVTASMYSQGKKKQQEVYNARVALARLDDQILSFSTSHAESLARLNRWLGESTVSLVSTELPELLELPVGALADTVEAITFQHPLVRESERVIEQTEQGVALARERFKPQFGIELAYGREQGDMAMMGSGDDRNKYSLMVMMDLPLFTTNRQNRQLQASEYRKEAALSVRQELVRQLVGQFNAEVARYQGLSKRLDHYTSSLLPDVERQARAALTAYQSDTQDFNSVIQVYRTLLDSRLSYIRLQADIGQSLARINYLMPGSDNQ